MRSPSPARASRTRAEGQQRGEPEARQGDTPQQYGSDQRVAAGAGLTHLGGAGELESDSPDTLFEFSLDVFVEGVAARARRRGPQS
ncbi:hypothetical protein OG275_10875 [Streptomyces niveus]|uniref:hypothetical protein n=1 Tax=Streptomyces niveus TaxID=193462 RepID=UPI002E2F164C|nr:hypothetical protein [Streptomyces niveus]